MGNNYPNEPSRVVTDEELPYCPHCHRSFGEDAQADEPVAVRYDGDGYGYRYIDNGSGSDWLTRHKDGEPLYDRPQRALEQREAATPPRDVPEWGVVVPRAEVEFLRDCSDSDMCDGDLARQLASHWLAAAAPRPDKENG